MQTVNAFHLVAFPLSVVLFVISVIVHCLTFAPINIQDNFPPVFLLHVGIFALVLPLRLYRPSSHQEFVRAGWGRERVEEIRAT